MKGSKRYGHTSSDEDFESSTVKKYTMWFMTETISPEAGQIARLSRTLGSRQQRHPTQTRKRLTIYGAYLCSKCTVSFCYLIRKLKYAVTSSGGFMSVKKLMMVVMKWTLDLQGATESASEEI